MSWRDVLNKQVEEFLDTAEDALVRIKDFGLRMANEHPVDLKKEDPFEKMFLAYLQDDDESWTNLYQELDGTLYCLYLDRPEEGWLACLADYEETQINLHRAGAVVKEI